MVEEAERFAEEDRITRERIEAKNGLENYAYSIRNQLNDENGPGAKLPEDKKEELETAVKETLDWLDSNQSASSEEFDEKKKELEEIVRPILGVSNPYSGGGASDEMPDHDEL